MLAISASTLLLISSLASASPTPQKRTAAVVPFRPRSATASTTTAKVFNKAAALQERERVRVKYADTDKKAARAVALRLAAGSPVKVQKRSTDEVRPLYDVALKRRAATSGKDALVDVFDTIDECE